jgi:hypothetical protein
MAHMAVPTQAMDNVAHATVGLPAAVIVSVLIGKGHGRAVIAGIAAAVLRMLLDTPVANVMADHGLQF